MEPQRLIGQAVNTDDHRGRYVGRLEDSAPLRDQLTVTGEHDCLGRICRDVHRDLPTTVVIECLGDEFSRRPLVTHDRNPNQGGSAAPGRALPWEGRPTRRAGQCAAAADKHGYRLLRGRTLGCSVLTQPPLADPSGEGYTLEDRVRFLCVCWWLLVSMPSWVSAGLTSGGTLESEPVMAQELPRLSARLGRARSDVAALAQLRKRIQAQMTVPEQQEAMLGQQGARHGKSGGKTSLMWLWPASRQRKASVPSCTTSLTSCSVKRQDSPSRRNGCRRGRPGSTGSGSRARTAKTHLIPAAVRKSMQPAGGDVPPGSSPGPGASCRGSALVYSPRAASRRLSRDPHETPIADQLAVPTSTSS